MDQGDPGRATAAQIHVELDGLRHFAHAVRDETARTLTPHARRARDEFSGGVPFGAGSVCQAVAAAQDEYHRLMVRAIDTMHEYVRAADALATAAERVAAEYGRADALSAAQSARVAAVFAEAVRDSHVPVPTTGVPQ
ncbi:MAG TPA: hypothetical protein VFY17_05740 [Pilimelia sp.]|nr:hypothetical protein [Pilimelia sp.]